MTITAVNDSFTYKSPRGDTERPADLVGAVAVDATGAIIDTTLPAEVVGSVASGAADSGKPVKGGAKYVSTMPTYSTGQRTDLIADVNGNLRALMVATPINPTDGLGNTSLQSVLNQNDNVGGGTKALYVGNAVYNGSTWDRMRGDTNGVKVTNSQNNIGNVGGKTVSVTVTPTVTASNSYGVNYVVGGLLTFANMFTSTGTGIIQSVDVNIKKNETGGFTLFLFSANPSATTWTDAAVAAINATDIPLVRAPIGLTANTQLAATGFTNLSATGLAIAMAPGATSLYAVLVANAALSTQFGSTSDVSVTIRALQDL